MLIKHLRARNALTSTYATVGCPQADNSPRLGPGDPNYRPPSGYKWDQFEPGNEASLKHGADSPRRWLPVADRLEADLLAERPWLSAHSRSVKAWARTEAQLQLLGTWLDEHGLVDDEGNPRPAGARLDKLESRAQSLRSDLAETPLSMARLIGTLTSTAVAASAPDMLASLKAEATMFVDRYLASADAAALPPAAAQAPPKAVIAAVVVSGANTTGDDR